MINFYKGKSTNYKDEHKDGIFFATDTREIKAGVSQKDAEGNDIVVAASFGKNADASLITEDLVINGGPLASQASTAGYSGKIPAGTSIQELLKKMFLKVTDGSVSWSTSTWSPSLNNPSVTMQKVEPVMEGGVHKTDDEGNPMYTYTNLGSGTTVEKGTTVRFVPKSNSTGSAGSKTSTLQASNGYFIGDSTTRSTASLSRSATCSLDVSGLTLSYTYGGSAVTLGEDEKMEDKHYKLSTTGSKTFKVTQSGVVATASAYSYSDENGDLITIYSATNTHEKGSKTTTLNQAKDTKNLSSSAEVSVTAALKYYIGVVNKLNFQASDFNDDLIRSLGTSSWMKTSSIGSVSVEAGKSTIIAVPTGYTISTILDSFGTDGRGDWGNGFVSNKLQPDFVGKITLVDGSEQAYNIFTYANAGSGSSTYSSLTFGSL